jgi:hypothetical protein
MVSGVMYGSIGRLEPFLEKLKRQKISCGIGGEWEAKSSKPWLDRVAEDFLELQLKPRRRR